MRITKAFTDNATHLLVTRAMKDRKEQAKAARNVCGRKIYDLVYPPGVQAQMRSLPDGAFTRQGYIDLRDKSPGVYSSEHVQFGDALLIFASHQYGTAEPAGVRDALVAYQAADEAYQALKTEALALEQKVRGVLASVSTTNKLFEVWPECVDILTPLVTDGTTNLPAVVPQELNQALKLP